MTDIYRKAMTDIYRKAMTIQSTKPGIAWEPYPCREVVVRVMGNGGISIIRCANPAVQADGEQTVSLWLPDAIAIADAILAHAAEVGQLDNGPGSATVDDQT